MESTGSNVIHAFFYKAIIITDQQLEVQSFKPSSQKINIHELICSEGIKKMLKY